MGILDRLRRHRRRQGPRIGPFWPSSPLYWEAVAHKRRLDLVAEEGRIIGGNIVRTCEEMTAMMAGMAAGLAGKSEPV